MFHLKNCTFIILILFIKGSIGRINFTENGKLLENTEIGTIIGTVSVTGETNPQLISANDATSSAVSIVPLSGGTATWNILLQKELDVDHTADRNLRLSFKLEGTDTVKDESLFIYDVNDEKPLFLNQPYVTSIPENTANDTKLNLNIAASDPDEGLGGIVIFSFKDDTCSKFRLSAGAGNKVDVFLNGQLDFEQTSFYGCTIEAKDGGGLNRTSKVYITVLDEQDLPPSFQNTPYNWNIDEASVQETSVGTVKAIDGDRGIQNQVNFTIDSDDCKLFHVDALSGDVKLSSPPDRDSGTVLDKNGLCTLSIKAQEVSDQISTAVTTVSITINDINDNSPAFNSATYQAVIKENMPQQIPIQFRQPSAMTVEDKDQGTYSQFSLRLLDYSDYFEVDPATVYSKATVFIRVKNSLILDYETTHNLTIRIVATEANNSNSPTATVSLVIEDVNDHSPVFDDGDDSLDVDENSPSSTVISTIRAHDDDSGIFGNITFSVSGGDNKFGINGITGELLVNGELDRETKDRYFVTVGAIDGGNRQTTKFLTINIRDKNDNEPIFQRDSYEGFLTENENFTRLIQIVATDNDEKGSPNSNITYIIRSTDPAPLSNSFTLSPDTGQLILTNYINYEKIPDGRITITAVAEDKGLPSKTSNVTTITITVTDVNEYKPEFNADSYRANISENADTGYTVLTLVATDDDGSPPNNMTTYSILSGASDKFKINSQTGEITTGAPLDREDTAAYSLSVMASDRGTPGLSSTVVVNITINDVNDEKPRFEAIEKSIQVVENSSRILSLMKATDSDLNNLLEYSIIWDESSGIGANQLPLSANIIKALCDIDHTNGSILFKSDLDREKYRQITLVLMVKDVHADADTPPQTATGTVTINVEDIDDNLPKFSSNSYSATILENAAIDTPITFISPNTMFAKDVDQGDKSQFNLKIVGDDGTFIADPNAILSRGSIIIKVQNNTLLDFESTESIIFQIKAIPITNNNTYVEATVNLTLKNVNEYPPVISVPTVYVSIPENSEVDTTITNLNVTDKDSGIFGETKLSLSGESSLFEILPNGTAVFLSEARLDRERKAVYHLTVEALDGGGKRSTVDIVINVTDVNDNTPIFERDGYTAVLTEDSDQFARPVQVKATDDDEQNTNKSKIEYSILSSTYSKNFSINSTSGELSISGPIDFESIPLVQNGIITLTVAATDFGSTRRSSTVNVSINIEDINDFAPDFKNEKYDAHVPEDSNEGDHVIRVTASDSDGSSPNKDIFYIIKSGGSDKFSINSTSGEIDVAGKLDREKTNLYSLIIEGVDRGTPSQTGTATVSIVIDDVNDESPKFYPSSDRITVNETYNLVEPLYTVRANDSDSNPDLNYQLSWQNCFGVNERQDRINSTYLQSLVYLNSTTGKLYLNKSLDRETIEQIVLEITVTDNNGTNGTNQVTTGSLVINVQDVNDNYPTFNNNVSTATVRENMPVGIPLNFENNKDITVEDKDKDRNSEFSLELIDGGDIFEVVPTTVRSSSTVLIKIKNSTQLDYEEYKNFTVKIVATETETSDKLSSTATIYINIIDTNDNDPVFSNQSYSGSVNESAAIDTFVTRVEASDADSGSFGDIVYYLQGGENRFRVNQTGQGCDILVNSAELDRETKDVYYLTVLAVDEHGIGRRQTAPLEIHVLDINDNSPIFRRDSYDGLLKEGDTVFERKIVVQADDEDEGENSFITYHLINNNNSLFDNFTLDPLSGELTLNGSIDYEMLPKSSNGLIKLQIIAQDSGVPAMTSNISFITITVTDLNDNTPTFEKDLYTGRIPENSTEDTVVTRINAADEDGSSPNNVVFYLIETGGSDNFRMNSTSGQIVVGPGAQLDKETLVNSTFKLTVLAVDRGTNPQPMSSSATVEIVLTDVNDESPTFNQEIVSHDVLENLTVGNIVYNFTATDPDTNPDLNYKILWDSCKAYDEKDRNVEIDIIKNWFTIEEVSGIITVNSSLDREKAERIILYIFTEDMNNEVPNSEQTATGTLSIVLLDVNDNKPIVSGGSNIMLNISESTGLGTELTKLGATDEDKNQIVKFSLNNTQYFNITSNGKMTLAKVLDREAKDLHQFEVIATDDGSPPLSSVVPVTVHVLDFNDNPPVFNMTSTRFAVPEDADNLTHVAKAEANDLDIDANANITYSLLGDESTVFRINAVTGELFVDKSLDRETKDSYTFTIQAQDNPVGESEKRNKATQSITVDIEDVNDCTPSFDYDQYTVLILETLNPGRIVTSIIKPAEIKATDCDNGTNAIVSYSLGANNTLFNVTTHTGRANIVVAESLRGLSGFYNLTIVGTDEGSGHLKSNTTITIEVQDENINTPTFVKSGDDIPSIKECLKPGALIYTFRATDEDKEKKTNGKVQYQLQEESTVSEDWKLFRLDKDSGKLTLHSHLDHENQTSFQIRVIAYDLGLPESKSVTTPTVTILLIDINDNPPSFNQNIPKRTFEVKENHKSVKVGQVKATDPDADSKLIYSILDPKWSQYFSINKTVGDIDLIQPLDRENISNFRFEIKAEDTSVIACNDTIEAHAATTEVFIHVLDVNDNPPQFIKKSMSTGFRSTSNFGFQVLDLQRLVRDEDSAMYSIHKYKLLDKLETETNVNQFTSDPVKLSENGTIRTNVKFETSTVGRVTLNVSVSDIAGNDTIKIILYIIGDKQVIKMTFLEQPDEVRLFQDELVSFISNITDGIQFVADEIFSHIDDNGNEIKSRTDMFLHGIDSKTGKILDSSVLRTALDKYSSQLQHLHTKYNVIEVYKVLKEKISNEDEVKKKEYLLIAVIVCLAVVLAIIIFIFLHQFSKFKRKLKAATIIVKSSGKHDTENFDTILPQKSFGRNNPLFEKNEDVKPQQLDDYSISSDELDENEVDGEQHRSGSIGEEEVTIDLYDELDHQPRYNTSILLNEAYRLHQQDKTPSKQNPVFDMHQDINLDELETTDI